MCEMCTLCDKHKHKPETDVERASQLLFKIMIMNPILNDLSIEETISELDKLADIQSLTNVQH